MIFLPQASANQSRKRLLDFLGIVNLNIQKQKYHIAEFHGKALQKRYSDFEKHDLINMSLLHAFTYLQIWSWKHKRQM